MTISAPSGVPLVSIMHGHAGARTRESVVPACQSSVQPEYCHTAGIIDAYVEWAAVDMLTFVGH